MGIYSREELLKMGFKRLGEDVRISTHASIYSPERIELGDHVRIDDFCVLSGTIRIGNYVHIAVYSALFGGSKGIVVGDFANISSRVCVYALSDDYSGMSMTNPMIPERYKCVDHGQVKIGRHVIIGTCSTVMPHVTLEEGCAFGAYSFINHSCEAWGIYAGIPCRRLKNREIHLLELEKAFLDNEHIRGF